MIKALSLSALLLLPWIYFTTEAQTGEEIFKSTCSTCHTIGKGRLVGPDLSGVYNKKDIQWLINFIRSSQKMVKSGDTAAVAIFKEFNNIPMPDNNYSDQQITGIIDYIKANDPGGKTAQPAQQPAQQSAQGDTSKQGGKGDSLKTAAGDTLNKPAGDSLKAAAGNQPADSTALQYTTESISVGRAIFNGYSPLQNKGSPCLSCHNIRDQSMIGGGRLALDLTFSFSKLGPAGINAILTNPPFPAMRFALQNNPLTPEEKNALISLLRSVDERNKTYKIQQPGGIIFFSFGFLCALFLMVHLYVFYNNRKIK